MQAQPFYYHGKSYGSEAQFSPLTVLLNGGYDILQLDKYEQHIFRYPLGRNASTVLRNLGRPLPLINSYGWGRFLSTEVLPLNFSRGASWWPNYQLHLVGGGMTYRRLQEWYAYHGAPLPQLWSAMTVMGYHLLNEMVENNSEEGALIDPIADIYLFDIGGILLFSSDAVARFFSEDLQLTDWSMQPTLMVNDASLRNTGQNFVVRYALPFWEDYSLLYVFGLNGMGGLSRRFADGHAVSVAMGLRARNIYQQEHHPLALSASLTWNAGVYWDRENSLLASLQLSGISSNFVTLNVYPGVIGSMPWSPGLWCTLTTEGQLMGGATVRWLPGVGLR
ncbi:MAG: hypothetical protein RRA94_02035 [Bacteroidota bacterium]|nr:hypothetical protein [Bacteroidota bacterium]